MVSVMSVRTISCTMNAGSEYSRSATSSFITVRSSTSIGMLAKEDIAPISRMM